MGASGSKAREARVEFYRQKGKIHARAVQGPFNSLRWALVWITQGIFFGACWLQWEGPEGLRQAVLFDIAHEKLYLFGLVLWPQDALLLALALILAATGLFLVTALGGRLFCGFACPQTVYTAIFSWLEARVEGDHLARRKLDQSPASARKWRLKSLKHGLWLGFSLVTAITFVGYFTPIRELLPALAQFQVGPWEAFWLLFYAAFTYVQAGLAREAVCQHMCPYSRFQGVMFDPATRNVAYDRQRGEPRQAGRQAGGDCVDCGICVQVCPVGIDIRDGLQYQCINCGLCIDACNQVMDKLGLPPGLIRFASEQELAVPAAPRPAPLRPRVAVYGSLFLVFLLLGAWTLAERSLLLVDVLRDRHVLMRETADGRIENAYTLKLMNLDDTPRTYRISVAGLPGLELVGERDFEVAAGGIRPVSVTVATAAGQHPSGAQPILFQAAALDAPATRAEEKSRFMLP